MVSPTDEAITQAASVNTQFRWFLGPKRGEFNEATIVTGWTPIGASGWVEKGDDLLGTSNIDISDRGYKLNFTVAKESRLVWADDLAVAVIARHYYLGAFTSWELAAWGYLDGSGTQSRPMAADASGQRVAVYTPYWEKTEVMSHQFGQRNLAKGATLVGSTPPLSVPSAEAPYEYLSQDDCDGENAIDEKGDTTAISSLLAATAPPGGMGDTVNPRICYVYAGRTSRTLGAGAEPLAIGISVNHDMLNGWGNFTNVGAVPNHSESNTNQPNNQYVVGTVDTGQGKYIVRVLAQPGNPDAKNYVQWNVGGVNNVPFKVSFEIKAGSTDSIGRFAMLQLGPFDGSVKDFHVPLSNSWSKYEMDFDSTGVKDILLRFRAGRLELASLDLYFEIKNLRVWTGYCDESPDHDRLFLAYDNGAGEQRWVRLAFDLTSPTFTIAPGKLLWLVDDAAVFRAKFDPGDAEVIQLKNIYPNFFINPGAGGGTNNRIKLGYNTNPLRNDYTGGTTPYTGGGTVIDELILSGYSWNTFEAIIRKSPVITGNWAIEAYPQATLLTDSSYGPSWWQYKLPDYEPPKLINPVSGGGIRLSVDDPDQIAGSQVVYIGPAAGPFQVRQVNYKDGDTLVLTAGVSPGLTVGTQVWPQFEGNRQVGHLVSSIEVRRREGKTKIQDGKVLTSILANPTSPTPDYERGTDWSLYATFSDAWGNRATLTPYPNAPRQVTQVTPVVARMEPRLGLPERAKLTELIVREYKRGATAEGGWNSHALSDIGSIIAHFLTQHAGVPASKVLLNVATPPAGEFQIAPASLDSIISQFENVGSVVVYTDPANYIIIGPDPASPNYTATSSEFLFTESNVIGDIEVTYAAAHETSQVRVSGRDAINFRSYEVSYPPRPARLGKILEIRDVIVRSEKEALQLAEAKFRQGYARKEYRIKTGPALWARKYMRVTVNFPNLDAGGDHIGVNCYIAGGSHDFEQTEYGGNLVTSLSLRELAL